jgi:hypothetical protein
VLGPARRLTFAVVYPANAAATLGTASDASKAAPAKIGRSFIANSKVFSIP